MADRTSSRRRVGRYEIIREIGRGGMAVVYLARQETLDRNVALKELSSFHTGAPDMADRFLRESRLAGSLNHPNIVTVHEYFEAERVPYIAMEYVLRGSLRPYVGGLTAAQIAGVLEGVLAGLTHAETLGIVHRDLKPENLMVTSDGRVKITDFGIAKATQSAGTGLFLTATGTTVGTPTYMAPEQAMGQDVGPATDLYSVGVMAWEHVVGRTPFHDTTTPIAILMRHVNEKIPSAREVKPDVDPELSDWIDRLLVKDARQRTQSPVAAWDELEEIVISQLGPRWRRGARLPSPAEVHDTPRPLTPAPFESQKAKTPRPAAGAPKQADDGPPSGYVTFGRPDPPAGAAEVVVPQERRPPDAQAPERAPEPEPLGAVERAAPPVQPTSAGTKEVSEYITFGRPPEPRPAAAPDVPAERDEGRARAEPPPDLTLSPPPVPPADEIEEPSAGSRTGAEAADGLEPPPVIEPAPQASRPVIEPTPEAHPPVPASPPPRGKRRAALAAVGAIVVIVAVLAVVLLRSPGKPEPKPAPAVRASRVLWKFNTGGAVSSRPAVAGGAVIIGSKSQDVYALDVRSGKQRWAFPSGEIVFSSAAVSGKSVYIGSSDGSLYALDLRTGTKQWQFKTQGPVQSSPVIDGNTVYVGSIDGRVYAVDARTGVERWHFQSGKAIVSSPRISDGVLYVGSEDDHVYALSTATGKTVWRFRTGDQVWSSPALANGIVYVGSNDDDVYALDQHTGTLRWKVPTGAVVSSSPAVANGAVFVGSFDHHVYALDAVTGKLRWRFPVGNFVFSSPTVANGVVYVGSHDEHVYAIDAATGHLRWAYKTNGIVGSSPAVAGGTVFVGSDDGNVYALKTAAS